MYTYRGPGGEEEPKEARAQGESEELEAVHLHGCGVVVECHVECHDAKLH
jgi:hypothetical protein